MVCEEKNIISRFIEKKSILNKKRAIIGFDGYVDEISRVVKHRDSGGSITFFDTIAEFSEFIASASGKSADMEIVIERVKYGGNAPNMAVALQCLGVNTLCVGSMGYPHLNNIFKNLPVKIDIISVCEPGYCHALEFKDGKLMFADLKPFENLTWERIINVVEKKNIIEIFTNADLLAFVNWSQVTKAETIWRELQNSILPYICNKVPEYKIFFDLADPSKKSDDDIIHVLSVISDFSRFGKVTLGLNENEAIKIYNTIKRTFRKQTDFYKNNHENDLEKVGLCIYENTNIENVLIHAIDYCVCVSNKGVFKKFGRYINNPKLTTGGGDNFNAGFCAAMLADMDIDEAMIVAMTVSSKYVETGESPFINSLVTFSD